MGDYKGTPGELIYEYTAQITQVVEYGASANAVFSGQVRPPYLALITTASALGRSSTYNRRKERASTSISRGLLPDRK